MRKRRSAAARVQIGILLALGAATGSAQTIFVNDDPPAGGANDGTSWVDAYVHLQDALADPALVPGTQVWVAAGIYAPDRGGGKTPGDRSATFDLPEGVSILGGFDGTEATLAERAGLFDQTVLTGDLAGDDGTSFANNGENSFRVLTASGVDGSAVLFGFLVTGGNANGTTGTEGGGGALLVDASPTIVDCTFRRNSAGASFPTGMADGGGLHNAQGGSPNLVRCRFEDNRSLGGDGGGMYSSGELLAGEGPTLVDCTFEGNRSSGPIGLLFVVSGQGGGLFHRTTSGGGRLVVERCVFRDNTTYALDSGGGGAGLRYEGTGRLLATDCVFEGNVATLSSSGMGGGLFFGASGGGLSFVDAGEGSALVNCLFEGNIATATSALFDGNGGGLSMLVSSTAGPIPPRVVNCTFRGNLGTGGNGPVFGDGVRIAIGGPVGPVFSNCVLWANGGVFEPHQIETLLIGSPPPGVTTVLDTSCVQGWTGTLAGAGTHGLDPLFEAAGSRLTAASPCVDAGDNGAVTASVDLDGLPRFVDVPATPDTGVGAAPIVDMGAYEFHAPGSMFGDVAELSVSAGGAQTLVLLAGPDFAGDHHYVLGTISGTSPGTTAAPGVVLPLNQDAYFDFTLLFPNSPLLPDSLGVLDELGRATATVQLPPGSSPSLAGLVAHHSYVVLEALSGFPLFAGDAVELALAP